MAAAVDPNNADAVRDAAREILSRPEFSDERLSLWEQILYYLTHPLELIDRALLWITDQFFGSGAAPYIAWTVAGIAIALTIFFVIRLTRSTSTDNVVHLPDAPGGRQKTSADLLADAERFESQARWRDAIRARYTALIARLAEDGIVQRRPGRTTGEYARELATNAPAARDSFTSATRLFEWVWYGDGEPSKPEAEKFRDLSAEVTRRVAA